MWIMLSSLVEALAVTEEDFEVEEALEVVLEEASATEDVEVMVIGAGVDLGAEEVFEETEVGGVDLVGVAEALTDQ